MVVIAMLEKENELRDILKELEQLDQEAYQLAEKRYGLKNALLEKNAQVERARSMTARVGAFAALTAAAVWLTVIVLQNSGL